jgi:hypothetical protein
VTADKKDAKYREQRKNNNESVRKSRLKKEKNLSKNVLKNMQEKLESLRKILLQGQTLLIHLEADVENLKQCLD